MTITTEADIVRLIQSDPWMMNALRTAQALDLPDWWIGAGFLRNKIWDTLENNKSHPATDVDLVYFNAANTTPETDWAYDETLKQESPSANWEVRNQARMHYVNGFPPYSSTADGIAHWTETGTAIGVKLVGTDVKLLFCYGTGDLLGLIARPTPFMNTPELLDLFHGRIKKKRWQERWPHLQIVPNQN